MHNKIKALRNKALAEDISCFIEKSFHTVNPGAQFLDNWHIGLIAEYLNSCARGEIKRLIINIPPRYLKSLAVSVAFPAWLLGRDAKKRIIVSSYAKSLSVKHSLDCRRVVSSDWYGQVFPNTRIIVGENQKEKFVTSEMGFRMATSVGGSVTGEGGDVLIVDDPHNPTTVNSSKVRKHTLDWFDKTFSSRLNDKKKGLFIIVMQRLHTNDLSGHLLAKGGWELLSIPAVAEKNTIIDFNKFKHERQENSLIHEQRESWREIENIKKDLGTYGFASQYQQNPLQVSGDLIKADWLQRYDVLPLEGGTIVCSWDTAVKTSASSDYSVCTTWLMKDGKYYLIDILRGKFAFDDLIKAVNSTTLKFEPDYVLIEDKASGQSLLQAIKLDSAVVSVKPNKDKMARLIDILPVLEAGKVFLPRKAAWLMDFEAELASFPLGSHDDQVDSASQFLGWARKTASREMRIRNL